MKRILIAVLALIALEGTAQNLNPLKTTTIIPPSPEVAAFGKYFEMPVGYSTGVPEINVPVYTVEDGQLKLPVSLSYNASGIKVEEAATRVGLGWSLSAGGNLSRVVRGQPDDFNSDGYMYTTKTVQYIRSLPVSSTEMYDIKSQMSSGDLDVEPDMYIFSIMGYSGRFYFDQQLDKFVQTPYSRVRIEHFTDANNLIKAFVLTLPNGVKCYFGKSSDASRTAYEISDPPQTITMSSGGSGFPPPGSGTGSHITSWQILDIVSPENDAVHFYYSNIIATDFGRSGESTDYAGTSGCAAATGSMNASFYTKSTAKAILSRITTDICEVLYTSATVAREDVTGGEQSLESISIKTASGTVLKKFLFQYGYFTSPVVSITGFPNEVLNAASKRLYLQSVTESDASGNTLPPYVFTYDDMQLPSRFSASQDFWGFYNGRDNGVFLTPKVPASLVHGTGSGYLAGADRTVQSSFAKAGLLKKVTYPTGGFSEYFYESNKVPYNSANNLLSGFEISDQDLVTKGAILFPTSAWETFPNSHTYRTTFTIGENIVLTTPPRIQTQFQGCTPDNYNNFSCEVWGFIKGITDPSIYVELIHQDFYSPMPPGDYEMEVTVLAPRTGDTYADFTASITWQEFPPAEEEEDQPDITVGGLRVQKIVNSDGLGNKVVKVLWYDRFGASRQSSGQLNTMPVQAFKIFCGQGAETIPTVLRVVSNSALPLSSADGQAIRYTNVTEFRDEAATSFKSQLYFSNDFLDIINPGSETYPFPSNVQRDWRSGLLVMKEDFEKKDNLYRILKKEGYHYNNFETVYNDDFGLITAPYPSGGSTFGMNYYKSVTEWYLLDYVVNTSYAYDANGQQSILSTTTTNTYNSKFSLYKTSASDSKGKLTENYTWYPFDYNTGANSNIPDLIANNMVDLPVKQQTLVDGKLVGGSVALRNSKGQVTEVHNYETNQLITPSAHDPSVMLPSLYKKDVELIYNSSNDLAGSKAIPGNTSYLWDYSHTYPVCQVINALPGDIAYTSFESDGSGNWIISSPNRSAGAITGKQSYDLTNGSISRNGVTDGQQYRISYWSKSGAYTITGGTVDNTITGRSKDGWSYHEHLVTATTATISIAGGGLIDEVRLYPKGAQMTSYTYDPLIGISSQSDANNRISYYEYDSFQRLRLIRDQDGNILKTIEYKFQQQQ